MGRATRADSHRRHHHQPPRPGRQGRPWLLALAGLAALAAPPLRAADALAPYPSAELWRRLQLSVLTCGRENTASSCEAARQLADPLLDHPRLPSSCKDILWTIREQAVVAASNSVKRRDLLNGAAGDLLPVCRQRELVKPSAKPAAPQGPALRF